MVFKNEFSWSMSRDSLFKECPRKYFFNYYGFWDGWVASEEERVKRIYYLKKLFTKELWVGSVVHGVVEYVLKRFRIGEEIGLSHALRILKSKMESDFVMSGLGGYSGFSSKAHRFFEDEYGIKITYEDKAKLFEKAELCLTNFFNSDVFMEIRRTPVGDWLALEDFLSFDFEGTRVYLSIDFAMRKGDKVVLYDWKTGGERKADYELQLSLYALYVSREFGVPVDKIDAKMFYLAIDKVDSFDVDGERLDSSVKYLRNSILGMKKLLRDISENEAVEGDFKKLEGFWCSRCSFRKVCLEEW